MPTFTTVSSKRHNEEIMKKLFSAISVFCLMAYVSLQAGAMSSANSLQLPGENYDNVFLTAFIRIAGIIVLGVIISLGRKKSRQSKNNNNFPPMNQNNPPVQNLPPQFQNMPPVSNTPMPTMATGINTQRPGVLCKEADPNFSEADFITYVKQVFMNYKSAWAYRKLSEAKHFIEPVFYEQLQNSLANIIAKGIEDHYESIAIDGCTLQQFHRVNGKLYLTARLSCRMIEYQKDMRTGQIIRGNQFERRSRYFTMQFTKDDVATKDNNGRPSANNCPNCGAPMDTTAGGICEYCGTSVKAKNSSWLLCSIRE